MGFSAGRGGKPVRRKATKMKGVEWQGKKIWQRKGVKGKGGKGENDNNKVEINYSKSFSRTIITHKDSLSLCRTAMLSPKRSSVWKGSWNEKNFQIFESSSVSAVILVAVAQWPVAIVRWIHKFLIGHWNQATLRVVSIGMDDLLDHHVLLSSSGPTQGGWGFWHQKKSEKSWSKLTAP